MSIRGMDIFNWREKMATETTPKGSKELNAIIAKMRLAITLLRSGEYEAASRTAQKATNLLADFLVK